MQVILLNRGQAALVDDADYTWLSQRKWYALKGKRNWYAVRLSKGAQQFMHRAILGITNPQVQVDHKDHNGLNNQRSNLRRATQSQNSANMRKRAGCSSQYKGVSWFEQGKKWGASIMANYKTIHLGYFVDEHDAALAYDRAACDIFGKYAKPNFGEWI